MMVMEGIEMGYKLTSLGAVTAVAGVIIFGVVRRFLSRNTVDMAANTSTIDVLNEMRKERDDLRKDRDEQRTRADTFAKERMEAMEKVGALTIEVKLLRDQLKEQEEELRVVERRMQDIQEQLEEARRMLRETQETQRQTQMMLQEALRQNAVWAERIAKYEEQRAGLGGN